MLALIAAAALSLSVAAPAPAKGPREADQTDNVKLVTTFPYENKDADPFGGGTDIDFSGRYVYAMQQGPNGGVHVIDHKGPKPKKIAFIPCPGSQNDVAVVKPGLIAIGFHSSQCGTPGAGVLLIDVSNPRKPQHQALVQIPGGTHTLTVYPGKPLIYSSPNGLGNVRGTEQIIDVSNPRKPEIVATYLPAANSCHDVSFHFTKDRKLAFCPGTTSTEVWDVSDPLAPVTISRIVTPGVQYNHSAIATHDGEYLVIGDEAVAGNDCVGGPTGSLWIYDITTPEAPILTGHFGPQRGPLPAGSSNVDRNIWCSAHLFNFIPGTYTLVSSWYAGGMNVIDLSTPSQPKEIAHYMGTGDDITNYWSAYWYDGRIYANDRVKGLDVFEVKGLKEGKS